MNLNYNPCKIKFSSSSSLSLSLSHFSSFLTVYLLFKCRLGGLTKGISLKICMLCPCQNK